MEKDLCIFVCTHGRFGEELIKSAEMIAGKSENVYSFSLLPLFGGTPCTTCAILSQRYDMQVISGLNLAMYIEITSQKDHHSREELIDVGLSILQSSGKDVIKLLKNLS